MQDTYAVAVAERAASARFRNRKMTWQAFCDWQRDVRRTSETAAEYASAPKPEQGAAKDGECFVAGYLSGGRRRKGCIRSRSMVVLDADQSDDGLWGDWEVLVGAAACMYPTHSSTPRHPKHRLVVPLSRNVTPEEYVPLSLKLAETLGFQRFDRTTYQPERLMYASSVSADVPFELEVCEGEALDPDEWLAMYPDWHDASCWPLLEQGVAERGAKAADPRGKRGIVGAFCRTYPIEDAIEAFLGDVYDPAGTDGGRYTFKGGSTFGGLVCYSGLWAYSNHATDPAAGRLCNAFDLVRLHRFGAQDEDAAEGTPASSLPSQQAMCAWASELPDVAIELAHASATSAAADFDVPEDDGADESWKAKLAKDSRTGAVLPSAGNLSLVMANDPGVAGKLHRDMESDAIWAVAGRLPWRELPHGRSMWTDGDDANLRIYIECRYGIANRGKVDDAVSAVADEDPYDPLRDYLEGLPAWDGKPRMDTLLIDHLGAEDSPYVRSVTRKTLCAAVSRALHPGCKADYMLILEGAQGLGKSSLLSLLAGEWFTDSLSLDDIAHPKTAAEKLQDSWIVEVAELDGMAKASIERLKSFLTTSEDNYRAAYAHRARRYRRRCIIVGTVNNLDGYLRDATGNRRFWPVRVTSKLDRSKLGPEVVSQIWAEALVATGAGERLYLEGDVEQAAGEAQRAAMETDPRESLVEAYLRALVPDDMDTMTLDEREALWASRDDFEGTGEGGRPRTDVSVMEIWHEALRQPRERPTRTDSYQVAAILRKLGWQPSGSTRQIRAYGKVRTYVRRDDVQG